MHGTARIWILAVPFHDASVFLVSYVLFFTIYSQYDPLMNEVEIDTHQKISGCLQILGGLFLLFWGIILIIVSILILWVYNALSSKQKTKQNKT